MATSSPSESRARQLLGKGASVDEVCRVTGLSKGAVVTLRGAMKLPPEPAAPRAPQAEALSAAPPAREEPRRRGKGPAGRFAEWEEKDYADFVEFWQETPVRAKACEAYKISDEELNWLLFTLKRGGVPLKAPKKAAINFAALREIADKKLSDDERKAMVEKAEKARVRLAKLREKWKAKGLNGRGGKPRKAQAA